MNNITPEQLVTVTQGATPVQIVTLVVLGVIALGVVVGIVKWVIDLKLGSLPGDLREIQKSLDALKTDMARLEGKLWDKEDIQREMKATIVEHIEHCPFFHQQKGIEK